MSWCDKLTSQPSVGIKLDHYFVPGSELLESFAPILNKLSDGTKNRFSVDLLEAFKASFTDDDGFTYAADHQKISVQFRHRVRPRLISGSLPALEMISKALPFTQLLTEAIDRAIAAAALLPYASKRKILQIGVVSTTQVAYEELPPGVSKLATYMSRPWKLGLDHFNVALSGVISETKEYRDRCIHTLTKTENPEDLMVLTLDLQRILHQPINQETLPQAFKSVEKSALDYFEAVAEGSMFDEQVISTST